MGSMRALFRISSLLIVLCGESPAINAAELWPVRLQLQYVHQFQFAGFYAALYKGFYRAAGLDVSLIENQPGQQPVTAVLNGLAEFGVSDTEFLQRRLEGAPLVALGVIFQNSGYGMVSLNSNQILTPTDLKGKRVGIAQGRGEAQFKALFQAGGLGPGDYTLVRPKWNLQSLVEKEVDAQGAYVTGELYELKEKGLAFSVIYPFDYGIAFYGDTLYTTQRYLREHPEIVEKFRAASFEGWRYAFQHVDEVIDYIMTLDSVRERGLTRDRLRYEAAMMRHLILPDLIEPGSMSLVRWQKMAARLQSVSDQPGSAHWLDGFIYETPQQKSQKFYHFLASISIAVAGLLLVASLWIVMLRRSVRLRTKQLLAATEMAEARSREAEEADAAKSIFVGSISHEFRTPLTAILGFTDLMLGNNGNPQQRRWLSTIRARALDLLALVNQILDFVQAESDSIRSDTSDFELGEECRAIAASFEPIFQEKNLHLTLALDPACEGWISGKALLLRMVLTNLLGNAAKFSPEGGHVQLACQREDKDGEGEAAYHYHFTVSDNGPGIPEAMADAVFLPFRQVEEGHGKRQKGSGLGLAICRKLVTALDGRIWFENLQPHGCRFHFTAHFAPPLQKRAAREPQSLEVLVVDDDPCNRELLKIYLDTAHCHTQLAENGQEAIALCRDQTFDFIVMDLGLPDLDGCEVTKTIMDSPQSKNRKTPVMALTASADVKNRERCLAIGMVAFLSKPINFADLTTVIQEKAAARA